MRVKSNRKRANQSRQVTVQVCRAKRAAFLIAAAVGLAGESARAVDHFYDGPNTGGNGDGLSDGGSGDWSTAVDNWDVASAAPRIVWPSSGTANDAIFGGTAGTVSLQTPITVHNLTVNTTGYSVAGTVPNILTLNGTTPTITVSTGVATIGAEIAGTTVNKAGVGKLTLTTANTYTGLTTVSAGVLSLQNAAALGSPATGTTVASGAALHLQGNTVIGAEALTIGGGGEGANPNTGAIRNISDNNEYGGTITLSASTRFTSDSGTLTLNNIVAVAGRNRVFDGAGNIVVQDDISGAGPVSRDALNGGAGTLTFTGGNTYTGATSVSGGEMIVTGANGTIKGSTGITIASGGTLTLSNTAAANNGDRINNAGGVTLNGSTLRFLHDGGAADYSETTGTLTVGLILGGGTVSTSQAAPGQTSTLTFASLNRATGATVNFAGTGLGVDGRNKVVITAQPDGNLPLRVRYNGTDFAGYSAASGVTAAVYTDIAATGDTIPDAAGANVRLSSAGAGGNLTLGAAPTTINALLQNTPTAATVDVGGNTLLASGVYIAPGRQSLTVGATPDSGTLTNAAAGGFIDLINDSGSLMTINSVVANNTTATGVALTGTGTVIFKGANTYTGATNVYSGTLTLAGNRSAAGGAMNVGTGAFPTAILNIQGDLPLPAGNNFIGQGAGSTAVVNQTAGDVSVLAGTILYFGGAGTATNFNTATWNLSGGTLGTAAVNGVISLGVNSYSTNTFNLSGTGNLNLPAGGLHLGRTARSDVTTNTNTFNQTGGTATVGTLIVGGDNNTAVTAAGVNGILNLTGGTFSATTFSSFAAGRENNSSVTIGGTAQVTLPAFPTARGTGSTAIVNFDGGTLLPQVASATYMGGLTNAFVKAGGAKFDVATGKDITVTQALLTDPVSTGGGLTKLGSGTMTLAGGSTYTGTTAVRAGTLALSGSGSIASSPLIVVGTSPAENTAKLTVSAVTGGFILAGTQTLAGHGAVTGGVVLGSGATIAPGNSVGVLTLQTGLTLTDAGGNVFNYELGSPASSDRLDITGGTFTSSTSGTSAFNITDAGGLTPALYTVIDFTGATSANVEAGDFVLGTTPVGFAGEFQVNGSLLQLNVAAVPEPGVVSALIISGLGLLARRRRRPQ